MRRCPGAVSVEAEEPAAPGAGAVQRHEYRGRQLRLLLPLSLAACAGTEPGHSRGPDSELARILLFEHHRHSRSGGADGTEVHHGYLAHLLLLVVPVLPHGGFDRVDLQRPDRARTRPEHSHAAPGSLRDLPLVSDV